MILDFKNTISKEEEDIIYILSCYVNDVDLDIDRVKEFDLEKILKLSKYQSINVAVIRALEKQNLLSYFDQALVKEYLGYKNQNLRKSILFDNERKQILSKLEENKVWYMPLKGCILQYDYPEYGIRQMSDNDILFDNNYRELVKSIFLSFGFDVVKYGHAGHDVYQKDPFFNFEMHPLLLSTNHKKELYEYYLNIKDKLVNYKGYEYRFTNEDFYIYMIVHFYKHNLHSGIGLRGFLDCFIYLKKYSEVLDFEYINGEFEKLGICEFESLFRNIALKIFSKERYEVTELTAAEMDLLLDCLEAGTYGTYSRKIFNSLNAIDSSPKAARSTKLKYLLNRLYPGKDWFINNYPICRKHHFMVPFVAAKRIITAILFKGKTIKREVNTVTNTKLNDK